MQSPPLASQMGTLKLTVACPHLWSQDKARLGPATPSGRGMRKSHHVYGRVVTSGSALPWPGAQGSGVWGLSVNPTPLACQGP